MDVMELLYEDNRIYLNDESGRMVAEVTFPAVSADVVNINHTFVDNSLRGKGIAGMLLKACADKLRSEGKRAFPSCSYAVGWFEKNKEYSDVYTASVE